MKSNKNEVIQIYNKIVYKNISPKGWAIAIMPDKILIDNFHHGFAHIHPDRKEIITDNLEDTFKLVFKHIEENQGVNFELLKKELIK